MLFLVPYILISSIGLSASATALNILPMGICISLMARPAGAWADRSGYRIPILCGALGIALATASAITVVWLRTPWSGAVVMALLGVSAGFMATPLTTGVLNSVDTDAALALRYQQHLSDSLRDVVQSEAVRAQIEPVVRLASGAVGQVDLGGLPFNLQASARQVVIRSLDHAFIEVMLAASLFALLAACSAAALRTSR